MLNTIIIIVYVAVAVIAAICLGLYGYKKGWKGGLAVSGISVTATVCAFFLTPILAGTLAGMPIVAELSDKLYNATEKIGLGKQQLSGVVDSSIRKLFEIPVAVILFILFFILFSVAALIIRKILKCSKEQGDTRSKIAGLSLAAVSVPLVLLFTFLVGRINIFEETKRADTITQLINKPSEEMVEELLHNNRTYVDIFFDTGVLEADAGTRLSLINSGISGFVNSTDDELLKSVYNFDGYGTRTALDKDLATVDGLYVIADENKLLEEGNLLQKVFDIEDKRAVVEKIYSLEWRDVVLRYVLSYAVRYIISDKSYIYPESISLDGTEEDVLLLLDVAQKVKSGETSKLQAAKLLVKSPLIPKDVLSTVIKENIGNVAGDEMADKVTEYIEKHDILQKIADNELPADEVLDFIDRLQNGELAEELRINEIKKYLEDNKIFEVIEDANLLTSLGVDSKLIENIKNGNYSEIDMDDILNSFGFII